MKDTTQPAGLPVPRSCDNSMTDHVGMIIAGPSMLGMGWGCYTAYKSLLILAETIRRENAWPDYTPTEADLDEVTAQVDKAREQARVDEALTSGQSFVAPGSKRLDN